MPRFFWFTSPSDRNFWRLTVPKRFEGGFFVREPPLCLAKTPSAAPPAPSVAVTVTHAGAHHAEPFAVAF